MTTTPELEAVYAEVRKVLELDGYDDVTQFDKPEGVRRSVRQMQIDGERLVALAHRLSHQLDEAEEDAREDAAAAHK